MAIVRLYLHRAGDYKRAATFTRMGHDADEWDKATNLEIFMREGRPDLALKTGAPEIPYWRSYKMLLACAQHRPGSRTRRHSMNDSPS